MGAHSSSGSEVKGHLTLYLYPVLTPVVQTMMHKEGLERQLFKHPQADGIAEVGKDSHGTCILRFIILILRNTSYNTQFYYLTSNRLTLS